MVTRDSLPEPERRTFADLDTLAFAEPLDVDELAAVATSFRASGFLVDIMIRAPVGGTRFVRITLWTKGVHDPIAKREYPIGGVA